MDYLEASRGIRCLLKLRTECILEMGLLNFKALRRFVLSVWLLLGSIARLAAGNVVLIGNNVSLSFDDIEANFGKRCDLCAVILSQEWCLVMVGVV